MNKIKKKFILEFDHEPSLLFVPSKAGRRRVGEYAKGEQYKSRTLLTESEVIEIKRLLAEGVRSKDIAKQFKVKNIDAIKSKKNWAWLKTPYDDKIPYPPRDKLTEETVKEIKQLLRQGEKQKVIAERYSVVPAHISAIATGKRWKHITID
ncbi:hypothetical protein J7E79_03980 [Bacillus sp. ISL-40]|uniref:hypothetical protein n=1 Tax=unclassified Bacillus (in: firmicutes) TaxID=185979 RepID=UPI001BE7DB94|nr:MULTISPECIES: hypothetical protein [unclassified Bacillus (in: firmicutes)]MBT2696582.1 hypothetical protein [Bacillus sp. ISL-40]MBT2723743.1 hypothetical protein [Bacillus sp. ISL-46]